CQQYSNWPQVTF
nr:immunoglobulin light chain junction region [Macaca mulatta]